MKQAIYIVKQLEKVGDTKTNVLAEFINVDKTEADKLCSFLNQNRDTSKPEVYFATYLYFAELDSLSFAVKKETITLNY